MALFDAVDQLLCSVSCRVHTVMLMMTLPRVCVCVCARACACVCVCLISKCLLLTPANFADSQKVPAKALIVIA